jgi:hypothetical protein
MRQLRGYGTQSAIWYPIATNLKRFNAAKPDRLYESHFCRFQERLYTTKANSQRHKLRPASAALQPFTRVIPIPHLKNG